MEIRTIRREEAEGFLRLMCEVFELDYQRALSVFFTEPFFDLDRKWALFEGGQIQSILTTTPLVFGWGRACGIAGVATRPAARNRGLSSKLLEAALEHADAQGERACLLFARDERLYAKAGFEVIDFVVKGEVRSSRTFFDEEPLGEATVRRVYDQWASMSPNRLKRDDQRWKFWQWSMRICEPYDSGYLCLEVAQIREAILMSKQAAWPVSPGTEWMGLKTVTEEIGVPLITCSQEMMLMGYRVPSSVQMFLTDQF